MDKIAKLMSLVMDARKSHDQNCPFEGTAKYIHFAPFDVARLGLEEGEDLVGLQVVSDASLATGRMKVVCDGEADSYQLETQQSVDAVATQTV